MDIHCPNCDAKFVDTLKSSLRSCTMPMKITPENGRMVSAKTVSEALESLVERLTAAGEDVGHDTVVHVHHLHVDDDMAVNITVNCLPTDKGPQDD